MWSKLTSQLPDPLVDTLIRRSEHLFQTASGSENMLWGKDFFTGNSYEDHNLDLIYRIHLEIWPEVDSAMHFEDPAIDHSSLLIKGARAAGTNLHQDRPYWMGREATATIFSVSIALEDMAKAKGGLVLSRANEVPVNRMSSFNQGTALEHEHQPAIAGGFPITLPDELAKDLPASMEFIEMARGEALAFDGFEPHMTAANTTNTPRLAMKIAYGESSEKSTHQMRVADLTHRFQADGRA